MKTPYTEKPVGALTIEEALYRAYRAGEAYKYDGNARVRLYACTVNNALNWWINTGRANHDFLKAFVNLSDCRMRNLFKKCIAEKTGCEVNAIKIIKAYLKVK